MMCALGNILGGDLKEAENNEDSRALQNLSVVMLLVGNCLLSFEVLKTVATILSVLSHRYEFVVVGLAFFCLLFCLGFCGFLLLLFWSVLCTCV